MLYTLEFFSLISGFSVRVAAVVPTESGQIGVNPPTAEPTYVFRCRPELDDPIGVNHKLNL